MRVHIGSEVFRVVIEDIDSLGEVDCDRRLIRLPRDGSASRLEQLSALTWRAWRIMLPEPRTPEEESRVFAMAVASLARDLERQGGTLALKLLGYSSALDIADLSHSLTGAAADVLRSCPSCGQRWCNDNIAVSAPKRGENGAALVHLACLCGDGDEWGCGKLIVWRELANGVDRPGGVQVGEHQVLGGAAVETFASLYPHKAMVRMVG